MEEILYRLDERTELIDKKLENQQDGLAKQRERVAKAEDLAQDNRMILSGLTFGLGTFITAMIGKLTGMINL